MFKLEKEMIPILRRDVQKFFGDVYCAEEFVSGLGRTDLVFAKIAKNVDRVFALPDYQAIEILIRYLNKKNKIVHIDRILSLTVSSKKKILSVLDSLIELGFIEKAGEDGFVMRNEYKSLVDEFVSIEAKLSNWRDGLYQAVRYKTFSNSSYLAISDEYLSTVDKKLLRYYGIGLISVSPNGAKLIIKAKKDTPKNKISNFYLTESFCVSEGLATTVF